MDIGESIAMLDAAISQDRYCEKKEEDCQGWKVELHTIKGYTVEPETLRKRMLGEALPEPSKPGGSSACAPWDLIKCNESAFPYQTHHIIPKSFLSEQPVCVWLTDSPKVNRTKYKLKKDNNYSVDHWENGYFMPFASTTSQWKTVSNQKLVCFEMMRRTKIQLHQGNHSSTDYAEQDDIETSGYKEMAATLLKTIYGKTLTHVETCDVCKDKASGGKIPVQPLKSVVKQVDLVSNILIALVDSYKIYVSRRAADYATTYDLTSNRMNHPKGPLI